MRALRAGRGKPGVAGRGRRMAGTAIIDWFMGLKQWFEPPRHILLLFLAVTLASAGALVWLGWHLIEHDRALERQRTLEHLDHAADHLAGVLQRTLTELENQLPQWAAEPGAKPALGEVVLVVATANGVQVYPAQPLLYSPVSGGFEEVPGAVFAAGEAAEYQQNAPAVAVEIFRTQARSPNPAVRAGALLRLGRNLRKIGRHAEAVRVYDQLARLGPVPLDAGPAELLAREARCRVWVELGRREELKREAEWLRAGLFGGRWRLDRAAWEFHVAEVNGWLEQRQPAPGEERAALLAEAVHQLWEGWKAEPDSRGRHYLVVGAASALLSWDATRERLWALVARPEYFRSVWDRELQALSVLAALSDGEGRLVLGWLKGASGPHVVRGPATTGLPWTLQVAGTAPVETALTLATRRRMMLAAFVLVALLLAAGGYFVHHAVARELAVARLQSEFVAAVSHEFRTPLTSLRQLTELLSRDRVPATQRQRTLEILASETERLHGLVEELLDFARMEAGAVNYRKEAIEAGEMLASLVAGFQHQVAPQGYRVEFSAPEELPVIRGDREALTRAVRNLLDNAVKYSPECRTVWVTAEREEKRLAVRVRDRGVGIPAAELKEIFKKFVRGKGPSAGRVKGTGIGLAMVAHAVRAHGGEIRVESQPGQGSTFTILLPVKEKA